jgi:hypothetical protein
VNRRPDPLFVFERLAALEKSLAALREERRASRAPSEPHRNARQGGPETDPARHAASRLARTLEEIASLDRESPDSGRRAVALAQAALRR